MRRAAARDMVEDNDIVYSIVGGTGERCELHRFGSNLREGRAPGCDADWPSWKAEQCSRADTEMRHEPHRLISTVLQRAVRASR